MTPGLVVLAAVVVGAAMLVFREGAAARRSRIDRLTIRGIERGEWDAFSNLHGLSIDVVDGALKIIEEVTGIPGDTLRPDDRFDEELGPVEGWKFDDELAELAWLLDEQRKGSSEGVTTVGEYVLALQIRPGRRGTA